jgi:uridine kinase
LGEKLKSLLGANCMSLDEFVLPERYWPPTMAPAFPFEYMRYDTFVKAVQSLVTTGECSFIPFDWSTYDVANKPRTVTRSVPVIVEGVSALHPDLAPLFDVRIFVESNRSTALQAALDRGVGPWGRQWRELFLPSADLYMATKPQSRADLLVAGRGI